MRKRKWNHGWAAGFSIVLVLFSIFTLLDAFVLPHGAVEINEGDSYYENYRKTHKKQDQTGKIEVTEDSYVSDDISIHITKKRECDTDIYLADIVVSDVYYLRTGLAGGKFGRNINAVTSQIAEENQAILAINGDYYGFRDYGFVVRNDVFYRGAPRTEEKSEAFVIYKDGRMEIVDEAVSDAEKLYKAGAVQMFCFGPGLIKDSEIIVDEDTKVEREIESNPRTAFGMIEPLHYLFVVSDGRTEENAGLNLKQLAEVMRGAGCSCAYNLDGGGSTTMWFMGEVMNQPTTHGESIKEREVSDIVYIGE